ncbi:CDP-alcohol phosphatidyltransferase family protein [Sphingomonas montana]|uniref:CDP-alcohol phosphatidyltransferase family protein n=1 Tax=Sphingomonas montana TaxID=1843236 RepID=UPI000970035E|nr:CDP-alcohol phosphatidyltransferase family protein [Sphingomonas montana]
MSDTRAPDRPTVQMVGHNPVLLWGMDTAERTRRIAAAAGLAFAPSEAADGGPRLLVDAGYAFDPAWLRTLAARPGHVLTVAGKPVIAHVADADADAAHAHAAADIASGRIPAGLTVMPHERGGAMVNDELRKREVPFATPLTPATVAAVERASYVGAYKGVTDVLTKYLWPEWALFLTRRCAASGISPNMVSTVGALLCVATTILFAYGQYWLGLALGLLFMVLDTVDGKLARCTITASKWGHLLDHGVDLIHPPFWYVAWALGLYAWGLELSPPVFTATMAVIIGGYIAQRLIEGAFIALFGMHIHVWRKIDSDFRLVTARRNPNVVILAGFLAVGRPDLSIVAVAWWTAISLVVHLSQMAQAAISRLRGRPIRSWLDG